MKQLLVLGLILVAAWMFTLSSPGMEKAKEQQADSIAKACAETPHRVANPQFCK